MFGVPDIDLRQFLDSFFVGVRFVRQAMVVFFNPEPTHFCLAHRIGELERVNARKVGHHGVDHHVHLHAGKLGYVVVVVFDIRI